MDAKVAELRDADAIEFSWLENFANQKLRSLDPSHLPPVRILALETAHIGVRGLMFAGRWGVVLR